MFPTRTCSASRAGPKEIARKHRLLRSLQRKNCVPWLGYGQVVACQVRSVPHMAQGRNAPPVPKPLPVPVTAGLGTPPVAALGEPPPMFDELKFQSQIGG